MAVQMLMQQNGFETCEREEAAELASNCVETRYVMVHRLVYACMVIAMAAACEAWRRMEVSKDTQGNCPLDEDDRECTRQVIALFFGSVLAYELSFRQFLSPSLWHLMFGYRERTFDWPSAAQMEAKLGMPEPLETANVADYHGPNHLTLGLTRFAFRDGTDEDLARLLPWSNSWVADTMAETDANPDTMVLL